MLEGCCLSNLWEAITYTVLHKDKHTKGQAHRQTYTYTSAHVHTPNTHTSGSMKSNGEMLKLSHKQKYPHIHSQNVHFMQLPDRKSLINST